MDNCCGMYEVPAVRTNHQVTQDTNDKNSREAATKSGRLGLWRKKEDPDKGSSDL